MHKEQQNKIIVYQDENGVTNVSVRFADEDLWLTQNQIAEIYDTARSSITEHIGNIYKDGELPEGATRRDFRLVQQEGERSVERQISHYNSGLITYLKGGYGIAHLFNDYTMQEYI